MTLTIFEESFQGCDWNWSVGFIGRTDLRYFSDSDLIACREMDEARMQYYLNSLENEIGLTYDYFETPQFFGPLWKRIESADKVLLTDVPEDEKAEANEVDLSKMYVTLYCASKPHPTENNPDMEYLTRLAIVIDGENRYSDELHVHKDSDQFDEFDDSKSANGMIDFIAADDPMKIKDRAIHWLGPSHCSSASTLLMIMLAGSHRDAAISMFESRYGIRLSFRSAIKNSMITATIDEYLSCSGRFAADDPDGSEKKRRLSMLVGGRLNIMRA